MTTDERQPFAALLHNAMTTSGVTKWKAAQCLGLSNVYVRDVFAGMRVPPTKHVLRFADTFSVPAEPLLRASIWERECMEIAVPRCAARVSAAAALAVAWSRMNDAELRLLESLCAEVVK
jgi:hypothetical protein